MTPKEVIKAYKEGFQGALWDQEHFDKLMSSLKYPTFSSASRKIKGSGEGKLCLPFKSVYKLSKQEPYLEAQTTGDCLIASSLVRMANGELRPITEVKIGDYVLSHTNCIRRVTNTFKKPYTGIIRKVYVDGLPEPLEMTPDHKVYWYPDITFAMNGKKNWRARTEKLEGKKTEDLEIGDRLLVPYGLQSNKENKTYDLAQIFPDLEIVDHSFVQKGGKLVKRFIELDTNLAWVIGIFLAEGTKDNCGIQFSLCYDETGYAYRIKEIIEDKFGIEAKVKTIPSRDTVLFVNVHSKILERFFDYICPGNVYSKYVHSDIMESNFENRLSCLRGWIDGDGHLNLKQRPEKENSYYCSITSVSASQALIRTMFSLAMSCKMRPTVFHRKKSDHQRVAASEVKLYGKDIFKVYPECEQEVRTKVKVSNNYSDVTKYGMALKIKKIEEYNLVDDFVYCIEVEEEHSFQGQYISLFNCVSHATRNAIDISRAVEIDVNGEAEDFLALGATEGIYGSRGHGGQGMSCSGAAEWVNSEGGILLRKKYPFADLTKYSAKFGMGWGSRGVPKDVTQEAAKHQVKTISLVRNVEEVRDALANGYGVAICSGQGFSSTRDSKGYAKAQGHWSHAMAAIGCNEEGDIIICNSWGTSWISGPKPEYGIPDGAFLAHAEVVNKMVRSDGSYAFSNVDGFPPQDLPDYGVEEFL